MRNVSNICLRAQNFQLYWLKIWPFLEDHHNECKLEQNIITTTWQQQLNNTVDQYLEGRRGTSVCSASLSELGILTSVTPYNLTSRRYSLYDSFKMRSRNVMNFFELSEIAQWYFLPLKDAWRCRTLSCSISIRQNQDTNSSKRCVFWCFHLLSFFWFIPRKDQPVSARGLKICFTWAFFTTSILSNFVFFREAYPKRAGMSRYLFCEKKNQFHFSVCIHSKSHKILQPAWGPSSTISGVFNKIFCRGPNEFVDMIMSLN